MVAGDQDTGRPAARPDEPAAATSTVGWTPEAAERDVGGEAGAAPNGVHAAELTLSEPVRQRVVALVAAALGDMPPEDTPGALRRIARFAPQRRAKLGGSAIAAQLASDADFRQRVADAVIEQAGELGAAVRDGTHPAAADPVQTAALAYLVRPEGWRSLVDSADQAVRRAAQNDAVAERIRHAEEEAERSRDAAAAAKAETDRLRERTASLAAEAGGLREQVRRLNKSLREAEQAQQRAAQLLATEKGRAARATSEHDAEVRRLRAKLAETEDALDAARRGGREVRAIDDARVWLLLETIGQAAHGLRQELALDPSEKLPADFVAETSAGAPVEAVAETARALDADHPARLDQLLGLPKSHLIVDGYNVTKSGFGEASLEQQRKRLTSSLGALAAQSGTEVTVVFDGAERVVGLPPPPRGVRVLFSRKGRTADELIRELVRAEPPGRAVVVISSDPVVADGVRRHGAFPLGADALLRRLARA